MVWAPATVEEKVYVADPFVSVRDGVCVAPSTAMVSVPVGVVVLEVDAEATVMLMASLAPTAGVLVAAESVVFEGTGGGWGNVVGTGGRGGGGGPVRSVAIVVRAFASTQTVA